MSDKNWNDAWRNIVEKSWADETFRQELVDSPNKVLAASGIEIPSGINFVVVENEPSRLHLVLPTKPGQQLNIADASGSALSQYNAACSF